MMRTGSTKASGESGTLTAVEAMAMQTPSGPGSQTAETLQGSPTSSIETLTRFGP